MNILKKVLPAMFVMLLFTVNSVNAQTDFLKDHADAYIIAEADIAKARQIINTKVDDLVFPNPRLAAQWYPSAGLGLFMHWGIHSVVGAQPSWDMIAHYRYGGRVSPPEKYYTLAERFNPQKYDPYKWLKAAKDAGFRYAVLTTKHHDGYALWPSKYGIGTRQYMQGRDLLKPYVDACRAVGMKIGFYFSPRDWHYPGLMHPNEYDATTSKNLPPVGDTAENYRRFEHFLAFVFKQVEELMTRYGKIDLLWFDGMNFRGVEDMHTKQVYAWIRSMQPDIVINDRWSRIVNPDDPQGSGLPVGDFSTPFECVKPTYIPAKWWECCHIWTGREESGWGYDPTGNFRPYEWFFEYLIASRSLGGNFLVNVGPDGNGEMHPNYYRNMEAIREWMQCGAPTVIDNQPSPGMERSNVPITAHGKRWFLHLLPSFNGQVSLKTDQKPHSISLLRTGDKIPYSFYAGFIKFTVPLHLRTDMDDVVEVRVK